MYLKVVEEEVEGRVAWGTPSRRASVRNVELGEVREACNGRWGES